MITTTSLLGLPGAGIPLRALGPDHAGRVTVTRAGTAMVQDASGTWQAAAADTLRFHGASRRLLVEAARTNSVTNPRGEGGVAGSTSFPTGWSGPATNNGLSNQFVGSGVEDGIPYADIRVYGTATGGQTGLSLVAPLGGSPAAASGENWVMSVFVRLMQGSLSQLAENSIQLRLRENGSTGQELSRTSVAINPTGAPLRSQRYSVLRNIASADTRSVGFYISFGYAAGSAIDLVFRIGAPQLEQGEAPSSLILPPLGSPSASSRGADVPAWMPAGGFGTAGTLVIGAMLPNAAPFGTSQGLAQIDAGSDANRLLVRNTSGGSEVFGVVDSGGTTLAALSGGSMTPGVPFRAVLAWAPGEVAFCLNGGAVQSAAVAPPAGLVRMLVGHASTALNRAANGEVALIDHRPLRLPNAMLQAVSAAG